MIDIAMPDINGYNDYLLMKFVEKCDYQQDFLDGKLFFNTLDFFAMCDDCGRGDDFEGNTFIIDCEKPNLISANLEKVGGEYAIVVKDFSNDPHEYKKGTVWAYSDAINRRRKVCCFYTAFVNIDKQIISPFDDKLKEDFGDYGVLILDRIEFFRRVLSKLTDDKRTNIRMGFVDYIEQKKIQGLIEWNVFLKKEIFSYQNEFRVAFVSNNQEAEKIEVGSLRDIAVPIMMEDLKHVHFEDGKIIYPIYK